MYCWICCGNMMHEELMTNDKEIDSHKNQILWSLTFKEYLHSLYVNILPNCDTIASLYAAAWLNLQKDQKFKIKQMYVKDAYVSKHLYHMHAIELY